jgi:hypothetical protein
MPCAAAAINSELVAVEEAERDLTPGTIHDVLCWPWLLTSTPAMTAHLDHWLTTVRGYGFDV